MVTQMDHAGASEKPTGGTRRERKKQETRGAIQAAARRLFDLHGFEGTTIRSIAAEAGVGVGTVHLHFGDKEALLLECLIDDLEAAERESWSSIPEGLSLRDRLLHRARVGFEGWIRQPSLSRAILRRLYFSQRPEIARLRALDEEAVQRLSRQLQAGKETGEIRADADPELAARAVFSFYLTSILDWLGGMEGDPLQSHSEPDTAPAREALEEKVEEAGRLLDLVFRGIGTPAPK